MLCGMVAHQDISTATSGPLTLSIGDAARLLGVSRRTFYRLLDAGLIRTIRTARGRRISRRALDSYIEAAESDTASRDPDAK